MDVELPVGQPTCQVEIVAHLAHPTDRPEHPGHRSVVDRAHESRSIAATYSRLTWRHASSVMVRRQ